MSQYGYGFGTSQPSGDYPHQSSQPYAAPQYSGPEAAQPSRAGYMSTTQEPYKASRNAIPGLGLNSPINGPSWQYWSNTSSVVPSAAVHPTFDPPMANEGNPVATTKVESAQIRPPLNDGASEEGELSEGELEDIYEPQEAKITDATQPSLEPSQVPVNGDRPGHLDHAAPQQNAAAAVTDQDWDVRDRSGSYSPYLSPREIRSNGIGNAATRPSEAAIQHRYYIDKADITDGEKPESASRPIIETTSNIEASARAQSAVHEAREHARAAILQLWPLNIRYKNYIDEGVDKDVLGGLFKELGLDSGAISPLTEQAKPSTTSKAPDPQHHADGASEASDKPTGSSGDNNPGQPATSKDKSEERKDRIARLLAAKGSKTNIPGQENTGSKPSLPTTGVSLPKKGQSEKSKLLQKKMEALKKAREAIAKKEAQPQTSTLSTTAGESPKPSVQEVNTAPAADVPEKAGVSSKSPVGVDKADQAPTPSIPGLFLSSTPQSPSQAPNQRKRPVAADFHEASATEPSKRPFGQARESRPFLIDVSDDEDDAEMEIDSPEQRPSSVHRPITPLTARTSFRDYPAAAEKMVARQVSSPSQTTTPPAGGSGSGGRFDLESMNKKIEEMKRKIAEAEARKKVKQSVNGSPSLPQSQLQSKEGSVESTVEPTVEPTANSLPECVAVSPANRKDSSHEMSVSKTPDVMLQRLPKLEEIKSRSFKKQSPTRIRAVSEKLPILEAHRKEQLLKLQHLQSEVARIEKEIQDSLQEEERLKEDVGLGSDRERSGSPTSFHAVEPDTCSQPCTAAEGPVSEEATVVNAAAASEVPPLVAIEAGAEDEEATQTTDKDTTQENLDDDVDTTDDAEQDVAMEEVDSATSSDGESIDESDHYEPPETIGQSPKHASREVSRSFSPAPADGAILEASDTDLQGVFTTSPVTQPISRRDGDSTSDIDREVDRTKDGLAEGSSRPSLAPYESPLQYFSAYRFHPKYKDTVAGGLRSLTYSNKIDVQKEMCPDQLTGEACPRGGQCQFQHLDRIQAPDDQILVQLGSYNDYEGDQKQKYIAGLRELLTDFRKRDIKDFQTLSQGIIEYRARFLGDETKILPLGDVTV